MISVLHNYYEKSDIINSYLLEGKDERKLWNDYSDTIDKIKLHLEDNIKEYLEKYIEYSKWKDGFPSNMDEFKEEMENKNKKLFNEIWPWSYTFFDYYEKKYKTESGKIPEHDLIKEIGGLNDAILKNNYKVNDNLEKPGVVDLLHKQYIRSRFFSGKNRWIRKAEIVEDILETNEFDYYVLNISAKDDLCSNQWNDKKYNTIDLLLLANKNRFTIFTVCFENYKRIDFDAHRNIVNVQTTEDETDYISSITVFRVERPITIRIPKTKVGNIVLDTVNRMY